MHVARCIRTAAIVLGLVTGIGLALPRTAAAQVSVSFTVGFPPPELPVYEQPICPGEDYIWTPGYWAWDDDDEDYYWVPGTWVLAPQPGFLWTPPYWGWNGSAFAFYPGYWGPQIGFYGGIVYGFGYFGHGYEGGRWEGSHFYYNRSVNNINVTNIRNVYNTTVVNNNVNVTRVSYNGGNGGVNARPTSREESAMRERHVPPVAAQTQHLQEARSHRDFHASENRGKPPVAATSHAGSFSGSGVVAARSGGNYNPPPNRGRNNANRGEANRPETNRPNDSNRNRAPAGNSNRPPNAGAERPNYVHPNELPKVNRPDRPPSSGNPKADERYQRQTDKIYKKQEQEHQKLQQKQEQEHQRAEQQRANDARRQQMEQKHQQQTQQMEQRHQQEQRKAERSQPQPRSQAPPPHPNEKRPPGR